LQLGGAVFRPPQTGGFANFARFAHSPNPFADFVLTPCAGRAFWRGCLARRAGPCWLAVVTETPLGHCFGPRVETPHRTLLGSDVVSVITPHRTVPISRFLAGANPPRGTGETCLTAVADSRGPVDQLHRPFPGCPGLSQGRHRSLFHYRASPDTRPVSATPGFLVLPVTAEPSGCPFVRFKADFRDEASFRLWCAFPGGSGISFR
jgi:hypothetical protein